MTSRTRVAIVGSGNIGTDLLIKILRTSDQLEVGAMVGIDPMSDGLARAARLGIPVTDKGIDGLAELPGAEGITVAFDATSAKAHRRHDEVLRGMGIRVVDLTPAAIGPYVVPVVNLHDHLDAPNINMVTCGGQATVPIVHAVNRVAAVAYAEIVSSIASRSAGPGTRANIDEFTATTGRALEVVGGAVRGKAIIVLNPAEPPLVMRNTVFCLTDLDVDEEAVARSVERMVADVQTYVPGYRLKQPVQFDRYGLDDALDVPGIGKQFGTKVSVFLEVEGAAHYLPSYAGNLDIMTSAALATAERLVARQEA